MSDGIRAAFEAWHGPHGWHPKSGLCRYYEGEPADVTGSSGPKGYESTATEFAWMAWRGAHARIIALLRARKSRLPDTPAGHGEEAWIDEIIDEIEGRA